MDWRAGDVKCIIQITRAILFSVLKSTKNKFYYQFVLYFYWLYLLNLSGYNKHLLSTLSEKK